MNSKPIKIKSATRYQIGTSGWIDCGRASVMRVVNISSGPGVFDVADWNGSATIVSRYQLGPYEVLYVRKDPDQRCNGQTSVYVTEVSVEG